MALGIGRGDVVIIHLPVGLVLALPFLVLHDAALFIEARLIDGAKQEAHAIGLKPEDGVERSLRHGLEIVGAVGVGRAVLVRRADLLRRLEEVVVEMLRAVEHQMFEQVREAGAALGLVLRADMIDEVQRHRRRLGVLMHDQRETVLEHVLGERNVVVHRRDLRDNRITRGRRRLLRRLGRDHGGGIGVRRGTR